MKIKFLTESGESFFILTISLERDRWYEYPSGEYRIF